MSIDQIVLILLSVDRILGIIINAIQKIIEVIKHEKKSDSEENS